MGKTRRTPPRRGRVEPLTPLTPVDRIISAKAFDHVVEAVNVYLHTVGWAAIVMGSPRVQQQPDAEAFNYEFVVRFTGGQKATRTRKARRR